MTNFKKFYLFSVIGILMASFYPLLMGVRAVTDMIAKGTVSAEDYPKYIIPYTPISLAVIISVLLLPVIMKHSGKFSLAAASVLSLIIFFSSELMLENKVIVSANVNTTANVNATMDNNVLPDVNIKPNGNTTSDVNITFNTDPKDDKAEIKLENWQMFMCYVPPESVRTRTWRPVDVLIGEYSPAFKLHFYVISVVLILSMLNCFYGFAQMIAAENRSRMKALVLQTASAALFLGLCIFACFTAFYRDGEITVSAISAVLMSIFFAVFGVTAGVYTGSFLIGRKSTLSVLLPSIAAPAVTFIMYIGEMILLSGNLYRFGSGFLFDGIPGIVLAPIDILIIIASGCITAALCHAFNKPVADLQG